MIDPKKRLREMFVKNAASYITGEDPYQEEDSQVVKYASRIKEMFKGIDDETALTMARNTVNAYVRGNR